MKKLIFLAIAVSTLAFPLIAQQHDYDSQGIIYSFPTLPGNVGIGGMPNPTYTLDVHGTINASNLLINGGALPVPLWTKSGNDITFTTGNVGIGGLPNSNYRLDVNGTINASNLLINGGPLPGLLWNKTGNDISYATGNVGIGGVSNSNYKLNVHGTINASNLLINGNALPIPVWTKTGNDISYVAGNVGIGYSSSDDFQLTVKSSLQGNSYSDGQGGTILDPGVVPFRMIAQDYDPNGGFLPNKEFLSEAYVFGYNENVSQSAKVYSLRKDGALMLGELSNSQALSFLVSIASDNSIYTKDNLIVDNNIGIGTTDPLDAIDLRVGNLVLNNNSILLKSAGGQNHSLQYKFTFDGATIDGPILKGWWGGALGTANGGDKAVLTWLYSGRVGIGTSIPTTELEVRGWVRFDGTDDNVTGDEIQFESQGSFRRIAFHEVRFYDWDTNVDMLTLNDGNVGIGTTSPSEALEVVGTIKSVSGIDDNALLVENSSSNGTDFVVKGDGRVFAREVEVTLNAFPDYVFGEAYDLMSLSQLRTFITTQKHLPGIKSAIEIEEDGIGLGELAKIQMAKIEELTLYILLLEERIGKLENLEK